MDELTRIKQELLETEKLRYYGEKVNRDLNLVTIGQREILIKMATELVQLRGAGTVKSVLLEYGVLGAECY